MVGVVSRFTCHSYVGTVVKSVTPMLYDRREEYADELIKKPAIRYSDWSLTLVTSKFHSSIRGEWPVLTDLSNILTYNTQYKMLCCVRKSQWRTFGCSPLGRRPSPKGVDSPRNVLNSDEDGRFR